MAALLFTGCAYLPAPAPSPTGFAPNPQIRVEVTRRAELWIADFTFDRRAAVWVFPRSSLARKGEQPWRPRSWSVQTPGVRLERRGAFDVLVAESGEVPERVRVTFTPFPGGLLADYAPALVFTDGSVAIYSGHFETFPMKSRAEVDRLPDDLNQVPIPLTDISIVMRDVAGQVWHGGQRQASATIGDDETYVLFGPVQPIVSEDMVAVLDPALPAWIRAALGSAVPRIVARYTDELGPAKGPKPTIMVTWAGATPGIVSKGGSVLRGIIALTYEGTGVLVETPEQRGEGLWFIAHEAAHFWLGQTIGYEYARDAWITEGGADLLAFRIVAAIDPQYDWRSEMNRSIADCARFARRGVAQARERNEHRAYYACGTVFGLVAEAASQRSFFRFIRGLIDANRADGIVTRAEWLGALDAAAKNPGLSADIGRLLDAGAADPAALIASLFSRAGVAHRIGKLGVPEIP